MHASHARMCPVNIRTYAGENMRRHGKYLARKITWPLRCYAGEKRKQEKREKPVENILNRAKDASRS